MLSLLLSLVQSLRAYSAYYNDNNYIHYGSFVSRKTSIYGNESLPRMSHTRYEYDEDGNRIQYDRNGHIDQIYYVNGTIVYFDKDGNITRICQGKPLDPKKNAPDYVAIENRHFTKKKRRLHGWYYKPMRPPRYHSHRPMVRRPYYLYYDY